MVIISDMDTQHRPNIWYLPSELKTVSLIILDKTENHKEDPCYFPPPPVLPD